jgi:predicted porin
MFAWGQTGQRTLEFVNGNPDTRSYDRDRWGLGTTFRKGKYRAAAEYIYADGMIFNGTDGGAVPGTRNNANTATASWNIQPNGEADGWYIDLGYRVLPKWELDVRYDYLDRMKNVGANEREFTTWTLGAQYFINKKTRALVNYQFRDANAPDFSSSAAPNQILDNLDNRVGVQVLAIF